MTIEEIIKDVPSSKYDDIVVEIIKINDVSAFPDNDGYIYNIKPQRVIRTTRWLHKLSNVPITTEVGVPTFGKKIYYKIDTPRIKEAEDKTPHKTTSDINVNYYNILKSK